ncbi:MAG: methyltransferase [Promethearchaeia archaeon]
MVLISTVTAICSLILFYLNFVIILKCSDPYGDTYKPVVQPLSILAISLLFLVPFLNSSLLLPYSYFQDLSLWFFFLGIIFVGIGIKLMKTLSDQHEGFPLIGEITNYQKDGVYKIMRHPYYSSVLLIFLGLTFIFDSLLAVLLFPLIFLYFEFMAYFKEKLIFSNKFPEKYDSHIEKVNTRIFPPPYSLFISIIYVLALYVGLLNFFLI